MPSGKKGDAEEGKVKGRPKSSKAPAPPRKSKPPRPVSGDGKERTPDRQGRRFGRRQHSTAGEDAKRKAALSSKSFRNRVSRGGNKADLLVKADDVQENVKELPHVGSEMTERARRELEGREKKKGFFGRRSHSRLGSESGSGSGKGSVGSVGSAMGSAVGSERDSVKVEIAEAGVQEEVEVEEEEKEEEVLDILRTAKISNQMTEQEITHKFPEVKLTPWGQSWAVDSFCLIHNAIKAEIRDLFGMAYVMQRRKLVLSHEHVEMFYEWWSEFVEFVEVALTIEEEVYFKWVGSKDYLRGSFKSRERMRVYGATRNCMANVTEYREKFVPQLPVGERLEGLLVHLSGFTEILKHHDEVYADLPKYLETLFKPKEKDAITKQMVAAFRGSDGYNRNLVLLARWLPERSMKRWALGSLRTKDLMSFKGWRTVIFKEHVEVAKRFEEFVLGEEEGVGELGAAMAINSEMRDHIECNRVSVRTLPKEAFAG